MRYLFLVILFAVLCGCQSAPESAGPKPEAGTNAMKEISSSEFLNLFEDKGTFPVTVLSDAGQSGLSGKRYAYFEMSAFSAQRTTHSILTHSDSDILIGEGLFRTRISYRSVRTYLEPSYQKVFEEPGNNPIPKDLFEQGPVTVEEYGLVQNRQYYAKIHKESYRLPPREPGGEPVAKTKTVLLISDRSDFSDARLTPLYRGWTY